jgi:hypothetical protein
VLDLIKQAIASGQQGYCNGQPVLSDWVDVIQATTWVKVFACPRLFAQLQRTPPREHLLRLLDIYDAYLQHDGRYSHADFQPVPYERRCALAARFRALVEQWTPPDLPAEMTQVARELLHAEGEASPPSGWDEYAAKETPYPVEDCLLWPEGVPAILKAKANPHSCDAEEHLEARSAPRVSFEEHADRMAQPAEQRRATYADYAAVPRTEGAEIIDGHLHVFPRLSPRQLLATVELIAQFVGPFHHGRGGPGGWWILPAPEIHLVNEEPVFPTLAGWRRERMPSLPQDACFRLAPDWVCEVLRPSSEDRDRDRARKMLLYARHGVKWMWVLDPITRAFEAYVLREDGRWMAAVLHIDVAQVRAVPFDAIEIDLSVLWTE